MNQPVDRIILADTNAAYRLYFLIQKGVIPKNDILIPGVGRIEFHPIVLEEAEQHVYAWTEGRKMGLSCAQLRVPSFFDQVQQPTLDNIVAFVKDNLSNVSAVATDSADFFDKRRSYEKERKNLQAEWKDQGTRGRKVESKPSDRDYSILVSAENEQTKIITNDEILLAIAEAFLSPENCFKFENILNEIFLADPAKRPSIEDAVGILEGLGETIQRPLVFKAR